MLPQGLGGNRLQGELSASLEDPALVLASVTNVGEGQWLFLLAYRKALHPCTWQHKRITWRWLSFCWKTELIRM